MLGIEEEMQAGKAKLLCCWCLVLVVWPSMLSPKIFYKKRGTNQGRYFEEKDRPRSETPGERSLHSFSLSNLYIAFTMKVLAVFCTLVLSLLLPSVSGDGYPLSQQDFVVTLNDDTFEHETQASTGQTTGSWLIWFHKRKDDTAIVGTVPDEEFWAEHHTIVGAVDVSRAELTKNRFKVRKFPALLYIHKGKVYRYPKEPDYPFSWDTISRFVAGDYANVEAEDVPEPQTLMEALMGFVFQVYDEGRAYFRMLGQVFGVMFVAALVNQLFFVDRSKKDKPKKKQS